MQSVAEYIESVTSIKVSQKVLIFLQKCSIIYCTDFCTIKRGVCKGQIYYTTRIINNQYKIKSLSKR